MIRFHPQWLKARDLVRSGKIGELKAVQVFFAYNNVDPKNIRNMAEIGGGAALDIGGYGISPAASPSRRSRSASCRSSTATRTSAPTG